MLNLFSGVFSDGDFCQSLTENYYKLHKNNKPTTVTKRILLNMGSLASTSSPTATVSEEGDEVTQYDCQFQNEEVQQTEYESQIEEMQEQEYDSTQSQLKGVELTDYSFQEEDDEIRNYLREDDDELLISLVSARPPLFDMRLPLKQRSRGIIHNLWEEVISELNSKNFVLNKHCMFSRLRVSVKVTTKQISSRWKNIRDSYVRARVNIQKKIASGSSSSEKLKADSIRNKHKHYELLEFLDDTLWTRR